MVEHSSEQSQQLPLFSLDELTREQPIPVAKPLLAPSSSLDEAIGAFERYMEERGFTDNTQQAFRLDLQILNDYLGPGITIGEIGTATLSAFLKWMENGRGVPCSPKTLERRITTLKVFFGWLGEEGFLPRDMAAPLIHQTVSPPLPDVLSRDEIEAIQAVTTDLRQGSEESPADARPHLLVTLVLSTAIKKSECTRIHLNHLDLADPEHPALWIRYRNARQRYKERRIPLPAAWVKVLDEYLAQYPIEQLLFPWTGRNLEYVLTGVAETAGVSRLTFETLRWTCALHDFVDGVEPDALRRKLGLSEISWYETENRLDMLARQRANRL